VNEPEARAHQERGVRTGPTSSGGTRVLGAVAVALLAATALFGLVLSPGDVNQSDAVRLLYLHVPTATFFYVAFSVTALGSVLWLWKKSVWWDLVAAASAEIGVLFTGVTLVVGALWGRTTWGTYWDWDPRLTTTALLFLIYLGYLVVRRLPADIHTRNTRAAVVAILGIVDLPVIHFSVDWWRSLHQRASVSTFDVKLEGLMLFTLFLALVTFGVLYLWLLVHRFRGLWLEDEAEASGLDRAIAERRAEAAADAEVRA
jgi:heme exporter protein C